MVASEESHLLYSLQSAFTGLDIIRTSTLTASSLQSNNNFPITSLPNPDAADNKATHSDKKKSVLMFVGVALGAVCLFLIIFLGWARLQSKPIKHLKTRELQLDPNCSYFSADSSIPGRFHLFRKWIGLAYYSTVHTIIVLKLFSFTAHVYCIIYSPITNFNFNQP